MPGFFRWIFSKAEGILGVFPSILGKEQRKKNKFNPERNVKKGVKN